MSQSPGEWFQMCTAEFRLSYVDVLSLPEELDLYVLLISLAVMWLSAALPPSQ